jgi:cell division protein ZipA
LASELRWILAAICVPLLAGIWWWSARRSRQAPGNAALRESAATTSRASAATHLPSPSRPPAPAAENDETGEHAAYDSAHDPSHPSWQVAETHDGVTHAGVTHAGVTHDAAPSEWGVPPFEPLSIRTADFDEVQILESPMMAHADPLDESDAFAMAAEPAPHASPAAAPRPAPALAMSPAAEPLSASTPPRPSAAVPPPSPSSESVAQVNRPQPPNSAETQRIVMVRVCAAAESRWSGVDLLAALDDHGLAHGRYQVFHRKHSDGRTLFCAASLVEPGTFNLAQMPAEHYRGLTLFAVLPGPADALQTVDALIDTAEGLAQTLHGVIQDAKGQPLTPERAEALREDVARFQALLTGV